MPLTGEISWTLLGLVFARCAGVLCLAPPTGWRHFPVTLRLAVAAIVAGALSLTAQTPAGLATLPLWQYGSLLIREAALGLALGLPLWLLAWGFLAAGGLNDEILGLAGENEGPLAQLYYVLGLLLFVLLRGPQWLLVFLRGSLQVLPVGGMPADWLQHSAVVWMQWPGWLLLLALQVAAPVVLAVLLAAGLVAALERCVAGFPGGQIGPTIRWVTALAAIVTAVPLLGAVLLGNLDQVAVAMNQWLNALGR